MTKLEEAANIYALDRETEDGFIAGAKWLLEQARQQSYPASEFAVYSVVGIEDLEELCEEK